LAGKKKSQTLKADNLIEILKEKSSLDDIFSIGANMINAQG
jgi:hypothetical protein